MNAQATTEHQVPVLVEHEGKYSELLHIAFEQVRNPEGWTKPLNALVPWEVANIYIQAIEYVTGWQVTCERVVKCKIAYAHLKAGER